MTCAILRDRKKITARANGFLSTMKPMIFGFPRAWVWSPTKKKRIGGLWLRFEGKIIINDLNGDLELPDENWNGIKAGGLEYCTLKPMSGYGIKFHLENISADINWEALTPVFDYKDCYAPMPPSLAAEHYEQSGKVHGTMSVSGRHYTIEGTGHRDHSWGVRNWEGFRSWVAFMGHFRPGLFFSSGTVS